MRECFWALIILSVAGAFSVAEQMESFANTQVLRIETLAGKPASLSVHLSEEESGRFCDKLTRDYMSSDQVFAIICDDRYSPIRASVWIREVSSDSRSLVKDISIRGKKYRTVSLYGSDAKRLYDSLEWERDRKNRLPQ